MMNKILILECSRSILPVIRLLANTAYGSIVGYHDRNSEEFALCSRYAGEKWLHPDLREEEKFIDALSSLLKERSDIVYIFPLGEASSRLLARNYDQVSRYTGILMANPIAIEKCVDKALACELAYDLNIPLPETCVVRNSADLDTQIDKFGYPFILKPRTLNLGASFYGRKCIICNSPDEFKRQFPQWPEKHRELIFQRKVSGIRHSCMFTSFRGKIIGYFEEKSIRTDAYDGTGNVIDSVSSSPSKQRMKYCELLTRRLDYTGAGCIQFIVNKGDGKSYFLEFNPRLDANIALPAFCGVDFPGQAIAVYQYLSGEAISLPPYSEDYPIGRRVHWLLGDLSGMLREFKQRRISPLQGIGWVFCIMYTLSRASHHMTWSWKDPWPTLVMYKREFVNIVLERIRLLTF